MLDGIKAGVIVVEQWSDTIIECNQVAETMLGLAKSELVGARCSSFDFVAALCPSEEKSLDKEVLIRRPDGTQTPFLKNTLPVVYKGFEAYAIILFDITDRKALERQVNMAQKLQSIGQLAAGIAHEINTPTQYVDNNIQYLTTVFETLSTVATAARDLALAETPSPELLAELRDRIEAADLDFLLPETHAALSDSHQGLMRIAEIVKSVKQLAHPGKQSIELVDLNEAVRSTILVSTNEWKYAAEVTTELDPDLPLTPCMLGEFNQVMLNLIINAAQAIQEQLGPNPTRKGRITIGTRRDDDSVEIRVADNGPGIPEEHRQKIFDPFFTTKEVGKGTGQGLAISHSVITDKHHGSIHFESEVGKGTVFIIRLPLAGAEELSL